MVVWLVWLGWDGWFVGLVGWEYLRMAGWLVGRLVGC